MLENAKIYGFHDTLKHYRDSSIDRSGFIEGGAGQLSPSVSVRRAAISEHPVDRFSRKTCAVGVKHFTLTFSSSLITIIAPR